MKIIVLDSTAKSIKAVLASSVATSNPDFVVAYADTSDNTFSELSSDGQLNGTTDVTLVGAPASGVKRAIKSITIYNRDTAAVTVSIKFDNGGTQRILQRVQLVSGETWHSDELTKLSPGGSDTQVQFNDDNTLAGSSNFTYNKTTSVLTLGANPVLTAGTANGVLYLNGSKVATSGSALTFDGTKLALGLASSASNTYGVPLLSVASNSFTAAHIESHNNTVGNGSFYGLMRSRGTQASPTYCQTGDYIGEISSQPLHDASAGFPYRSSGYIRFEASGNHSISSLPTDLIFGLAGSGSVSPSEQMRLTSTGLGIGTSSPNARLELYTSGTTNLRLSGSLGGGNSVDFYNFIPAVSNDGFSIALSGTTRLALTNAGNLGIGTSSPAAKLDVVGTVRATSQTVPASGTGAELFYDATNAGLRGYNRTGSAYVNLALNDNVYVGGGSNGNVGIGTSSPQNRLDLGSTSSGRGITWENYVNVFSEYSSGALYLSSNYYGNIGSSGFKTSLTASFGAAGISVSGTSGSGNGGLIQFFVDPATSKTAGNAFTPTERARITSGGDFWVGTTTAISPGGLTANNVLSAGTSSQWAAAVRNSTATTPWGLAIQYSGASPNGTSSTFLFCEDSTATRATIRSNGGIANYQANDVNLSDRREKTNFAPAKSYLATICAIPVQTFNYIDQSEDDPGLTLGVVAQDVQAVAPELVMESNWGTADEPKVRLSIYQTDLQYALMKALQELKAEFDAYKATHP